MPTVTNPGETYYALKFPDGIAAGDFAARLRDFLRSPEGARFREDGRTLVWITSPRRGIAKDDFCCVYLSEAAFEAARAAGLPTPDAERVHINDLPEQRLLVIGEAAASAAADQRDHRDHRDQREQRGPADDPSLRPGA
jgi:hypothetical protein